MLTEHVNEYRIECWRQCCVWHWRVKHDGRCVMRGTATGEDAARISAREWIAFKRRERFALAVLGVG